MIRFDVLGSPAPKGSAQAFVSKRTGRAHIVTGGAASTRERMKAWDAAVREAAVRTAQPQDGPRFVGKPLEVAILFRMRRPKGHWNKKTGALLPRAPARPTTKPDIDKLVRTTLDALTGIVFDDDSSVVELNTSKEYATPGTEGATILVREWRAA